MPLFTKEWRQVRGATQVVELYLGLRIEIRGEEQLSAHHIGGQECVSLRQDHEIDGV
jgi:hypothetical protein